MLSCCRANLCPCNCSDMEDKLRNDKICFDVSMSVIAAILSFVFTGRLNGVREGTIIAALLVGFIARVAGKKLAFVKPMLFPEEYAGENAESTDKVQADSKSVHAAQRNVILIGRQFGSVDTTLEKHLQKNSDMLFMIRKLLR